MHFQDKVHLLYYMFGHITEIIYRVMKQLDTKDTN